MVSGRVPRFTSGAVYASPSTVPERPVSENGKSNPTENRHPRQVIDPATCP